MIDAAMRATFFIRHERRFVAVKAPACYDIFAVYS